MSAQPMNATPARVLELANGRRLAYQCYGRANGRPLFFFHGLPGSRLQAALIHEAALGADLCVIAPDRPGFGQSTPQPARRILDWPRDVSSLADHLGHARFGVLGLSCGGPYALACAHELPDRVTYTGLLAGMAPMDVPSIRAGQLAPLRLMFALARLHPWLASPLVLPDLILFRRNPGRAVRALAALLAEPDRRLLQTTPVVAERFGASLAEAYRQGIGGALHEAHLIASPRGYALEAVRVPVHIHQPEHDRHVPPAMGEYLASHIPDASLHRYPDDGHLSIVVSAIDTCLRQARINSSLDSGPEP